MERRTGGWRAALAPEMAAGLAAVLIWGVLGVGLLAGAGGDDSGASPSASDGVATATAAPQATLDRSLLVLIRSTHARLQERKADLETLLAAETLDTPEVRATIRQINSAATYASSIADRIAEQPGGIPVAAALHDAYRPILATADEISSLALANEAGHRSGAERMVELIDALPDVDDLVAAVQPTPSPTPEPTASAAPASPSPTPKPTKSATAAPTEAATPTPGDSAEPTATPISSAIPSLAVNLLENPGFESGPGPWEFVLGTGASGSYTITTDDPASGTSAALLSLTGGVGPWSAASLRQGGLRLDNGAVYHVQVWARSNGPRDIRVRVTSGLGEVIASRILTIGTDWSQVGFDVTPIGSVDGASLVIETGISPQPVWLDDLGLGP